MTLNWVNEKVYIGQYSGKNPNYLGSGVYLRNAIKKHGKENFTRMTLEKGIVSQELLNQLEMYWVEFCDSTNKKKGYNLTKGGGGMSGFSHPQTKEARKRLSEARKGLTLSPEWRANISASMKGKQTGADNHNYGKQHTQESIDKMKIQWQKRTRVKGTFTQTQESNDKRSKSVKAYYEIPENRAKLSKKRQTRI